MGGRDKILNVNLDKVLYSYTWCCLKTLDPFYKVWLCHALQC